MSLRPTTLYRADLNLVTSVFCLTWPFERLPVHLFIHQSSYLPVGSALSQL